LFDHQRDAGSDNNECDCRAQTSRRDTVNASADNCRCFVHGPTFLEQTLPLKMVLNLPESTQLLAIVTFRLPGAIQLMQVQMIAGALRTQYNLLEDHLALG
jgi:hypothetical protein